MSKSNRIFKPGIIIGNPRTANSTRKFIDGSIRSQTTLRTAAIGIGTYKPGWRWSLHAGAQTGKQSENHIGYVISGRMKVKDPFGNEAEIEPGYAFEIIPGSDAWVIGNEPCFALDFIPISNAAKSK